LTANPCLLCDTELGDVIDPGQELGGVTSDMKPWPHFGRIVVCGRCGHVQKNLNRAWTEQVRRIYDEYELNELSGGVEQVVFLDGAPLTRSDRVLGRVDDIPARGRMLDVGCGNGATLRAFGRRFPEWSLFGFEVNARTRDEVLSLAGVEGFFEHELEDVEGQFDCITLFHVLEHLPEPRRVMRWVREHLAPEGLLIIQVPDIAANPLDLVVFDHSSHFDRGRLTALATALGFDVAHAGPWVPKELSAVFRRGTTGEREIRAADDALDVQTQAQADIEWLAATLDAARAHAEGRPLGIFGTAVAGTWLGGSLGDRVSFFVDQDPQRIGKTHLGVPVLGPSDVPEGSNVFIAFTPPLAQKIADRLAADPINWTLVCPPERRRIGVGATTLAPQA
jgi:2-polyprenyl-3-methyl-5-hydroxy-6-metoxy-1,4-benzoquinol methylase